MKITVIPGNTYSVTTATGCTVTDERGRTLTTVDAGTQGAFMTTSPTVTITDAEATVLPFADSPVISNGGAKIKIDETPTEGSENAVSSGGVYEAIEPLEEVAHSHVFTSDKLITSEPNAGHVAVYTYQVPVTRNNATLTGIGNTLIGNEIQLQGSPCNNAVLIGRRVIAGFERCVIIGGYTWAHDSHATVVGMGGEGNESGVAVGRLAKAGKSGTAVGTASNAFTCATMIGSWGSASGRYTTAVGEGAEDNLGYSSMLYSGLENSSGVGRIGSFVGTEGDHDSDEHPTYFRVGNTVIEKTSVTNDDGSVTTTTTRKNKGVKINMELLMTRLLELGGEEFEYTTSTSKSTVAASTASLLPLDEETPVVTVEEKTLLRSDGTIASTEETFSDGTKKVKEYNPYGEDDPVIAIEKTLSADGVVISRTITYTNGNTTTENYES